MIAREDLESVKRRITLQMSELYLLPFYIFQKSGYWHPHSSLLKSQETFCSLRIFFLFFILMISFRNWNSSEERVYAAQGKTVAEPRDIPGSVAQAMPASIYNNHIFRILSFCCSYLSVSFGVALVIFRVTPGSAVKNLSRWARRTKWMLKFKSGSAAGKASILSAILILSASILSGPQSHLF